MKYISVAHTCADCGGCIGQDNGPPDGWQLEDGRTVCHACCVVENEGLVYYINGIKQTVTGTMQAPSDSESENGHDGFKVLTVEDFVKSQRKGF